MKGFRLVPLILTVIAVCIVFVVYAQSPNTIQGCYSNGNGSLRRVNSPSECNHSETPISWNVTGPQGPPGPPGGNIGVTGRWEGNLTGTVENCGYFGSNSLSIIFIELPSGDIAWSTKDGARLRSTLYVVKRSRNYAQKHC